MMLKSLKLERKNGGGGTQNKQTNKQTIDPKPYGDLLKKPLQIIFVVANN